MDNTVNRAKQFLPFDALKGLKEELRKKETEHQERIELSEESLIELENKFNSIEKGCSIKIRYYKNTSYIELTGLITGIDYIRKKIQINNTENINACDIIEILKV